MKSGQRQGLILTGNFFPGYQIATLLRYRGWNIKVEHSTENAHSSMHKCPIDILVADVDEPGGIELLANFKDFRPIAYSVALGRSGPSKAMRLARSLGVDGYFYTSHSGHMLDVSRGMAPYFLAFANMAGSDLHHSDQQQAGGYASKAIPHPSARKSRKGKMLQSLSMLQRATL